MRIPKRAKTPIEDAIAKAIVCLRERGDGKLSALCEAQIIRAIQPTVYVVHSHERSEGSTIRTVRYSGTVALDDKRAVEALPNFGPADEVEIEPMEITR